MIWCSGNANSWLEPVIEHLVEKQDQPRGAQVYAMHLSGCRMCSQDSPLPRPHLMVCSGGKAILLEIPAYLRPSKSKQIFFFLCFCAFGCCIWPNPHLLQSRTLLLRYHCCVFHCICTWSEDNVGNDVIHKSVSYVVNSIIVKTLVLSFCAAVLCSYSCVILCLMKL